MSPKNSITRNRSIQASARLRKFKGNLLGEFDLLESRTLMAGLPTVIELVPDLIGSNPQNFTNVNNTVFFTSIAQQGNELWRTDGTPAGTKLVRDIRSGGESSNPSFLTNVNGTLFFSANDGVNGDELWKSDGTEFGTVMVKDIFPGTNPLGTPNSSAPSHLTNVNGTLFFSASNGEGSYNNPSFAAQGREPWKSNGSSVDTVMVYDLYPRQLWFNTGSDPKSLTNVNGTLFFTANKGSLYGRELWKLDPTQNFFPILVKDIGPGLSSALISSLTNVNGTLFFDAYLQTTGIELWKSDGTIAGTTLVKDIAPGTISAAPKYLTNVNGTLFFSADNGTTGTELWKSDGTSVGTTLVKDIRVGSSAFPKNLTNVNGTLFFQANDGANGLELWKSNGTVGGTVLVKQIRPGALGSNPYQLTNLNGTLFFNSNDGSHGYELWKIDGTAAGTSLVQDINPGIQATFPRFLTNVNGHLFFQADFSSQSNGELWVMDGGGESPVYVTGVTDWGVTGPGVRPYFVNGLRDLGLKVSGVGLRPSTPPSIIALIDIVGGAGAANPQNFTNVNGRVYFTASRADTGRELWSSDGTVGGTVLVKDVRPGPLDSGIGNLTNLNGQLTFTANDGVNGNELWSSNGSPVGTALVRNIRLSGFSANPNSLTNVNGTLFFAATTGSIGSLAQTELWKSDGTTAGTVLVKDIAEDSLTTFPSSAPSQLTNVNGLLMFTAADYYVANNGTNGRELWRSDGTTNGTFLVKDINPGPGSSNPAGLTNIKGTTYFSANDGSSGIELWKCTSWGLFADTVLVKDINPGPNSSNPATLTNLNGRLMFAANTGVVGIELWASNGRVEGTYLVKDINPGAGSSSPANLTNLNGTLMFSAFEPTTGVELHRSNGSLAGTVLVKDINAGALGSVPQNFVNHNSTLYFSAANVTTGREIYSSGIFGFSTRLIVDIAAGVNGSNPAEITSANTSLFFSASNGVNGRELYVLANPFAALRQPAPIPLVGGTQGALPKSANKIAAGFVGQQSPLPTLSGSSINPNREQFAASSFEQGSRFRFMTSSRNFQNLETVLGSNRRSRRIDDVLSDNLSPTPNHMNSGSPESTDLNEDYVACDSLFQATNFDLSRSWKLVDQCFAKWFV